jgi:cytochrome c oxidase subunit 1
VAIASVPIDLQVHDTYFIVAHFHYVLIGGAVFPLIGGIYYWFPKMTGRVLDERLGTWNFWMLFVGFNVTFFPMHQLGLRGMPRRVYTYPADVGWGTLNLVSTGGALLLIVGGLLLIYNVVRSLRSGETASDNPWQADTLEWSVSSPPPVYNFLRIPVVEGRNALWDRSAAAPVVVGVKTDKRWGLVTSVTDAAPVHQVEYPEPTIWPFLAALVASGLLVGSIFTPWALVWGAPPLFVTLTGWFWPKPSEEAKGHEPHAVAQEARA